jgi:hypothetical protein
MWMGCSYVVKTVVVPLGHGQLQSGFMKKELSQTEDAHKLFYSFLTIDCLISFKVLTSM